MRIHASVQDRLGTSRRLARPRRVLATIAVTAMVLVMAACGGGEGDSDGEGGGTLRVAILPISGWLPVMVAEDQGYFEENGLTVEITDVQQSPTTAIGRQFDIGQATGTDIIQAVNGGIDQVLVSNIAQETDTTKIIVPADSDIEDLADLEGKRIGIATRTSVIAQTLLLELSKEGIEESDVTLQEMPFPTMLDQLNAGQVDAIAPTEPFVGQAVAAGNRPLTNPLLTATAEFTGGEPPMLVFAAASREWAESHPEQVEAWRASLEQANQFILDNEDEARDIFQRYTGLPEQVAQNVPLYDYDATPTTAEQIGVWLDVLKSSGGVPEDSAVDPAKLVVE